MYSVGMTTETNLQSQALTTIANAEFRQAWPIEVRRVLVKAVRTEGEMPAYAVTQVRWALKEARNIERRFAKDIEAGERTMSHAERRRLEHVIKAGAR